MNNKFIISSLAFGLCLCFTICSCKDSKGQTDGTEESPAEALMKNIKTLFEKGEYEECLDSIYSLRARFPEAAEERKECLEIERDAKISIAQDVVLKTDSALQATLLQIEEAPTLLEQNMLRNKRDSLKTVLDVQTAAIRKYRMMKENK